jgi:hypothetical protein
VVVAMTVMRVVQVLTDAIIDVVTMGDCLMAAAGTMDMARIVPAALVVRRAAVGVPR